MNKQATNKPTDPTDFFRLGPVLADNRSAERSRRSLEELIAISQELGANILTLPNTPVTITLTGPGVIILATPYQATNLPIHPPNGRTDSPTDDVDLA